jgi:hypothetical protein
MACGVYAQTWSENPAALVNLFMASEYVAMAGLAAIAWTLRSYMTLQSEERVLSAGRRHSPGTEHWL